MSTTFGVNISEIEIEIKLNEYDELPEDVHLNIFEPVAIRSYSSIYFSNSIAHLLPDETPVYPLDNSAQGIFTIGDIKKILKNK